MGIATKPRLERVVTSQPMNGTTIPVEVATHVTGVLEFVSGAVVSITCMSFDVPKHKHVPIENLWPQWQPAGARSQPVRRRGDAGQDRRRVGAATTYTHGNTDGEFRSIGVADMAAAIVDNRPHRASGALALHVLEAMEAFQTSSDQGRRIKLETTVERPAPMRPGLATGQID